MNLPLFHPRETPLDTARRERAEHRDACDRCIGGLDCPTADDLDRRLIEAIDADLPWGYPVEGGRKLGANSEDSTT